MGRILVVDDSKTDASRLIKIALNLGHEVSHCDDGENAEEAITKFKPDVIFMDIVMPGRNGFETVRYLRCHKKWSFDQLPIYMLTSKGETTDKAWSERQGANGHFVKPADEKEISNLLENIL